MKGRHIAPLLMISSALAARGASPTTIARTRRRPPPPGAAGLPVEKVAIQTYVFASRSRTSYPAEWDTMPVGEEFKRLKPSFAKLAGAKPTRPARVGARADLGDRLSQYRGDGPDRRQRPGRLCKLLKDNGLHAVASHASLDKAKWPAISPPQRRAGSASSVRAGSASPGSTPRPCPRNRAQPQRAPSRQRRGAHPLCPQSHRRVRQPLPYDHGDGKPVMTSAWEIVASVHRPALRPVRGRHLLGAHGVQARSPRRPARLPRKISQPHRVLAWDLAPNGAVTIWGPATDWRRVIEAAGPQIAYYVYGVRLSGRSVKSATIGFNYLTCGERSRLASIGSVSGGRAPT